MSNSIILAAAVKSVLDKEVSKAEYGIAVPRIKQAIDAYFNVRPHLQGEIPSLDNYGGETSPPEIYTTSNEDAYYRIDGVHGVVNELAMFLDMWSQSNSFGTTTSPKPRRVFISHGRPNDWFKVKDHLENVMEIPTLELSQQINDGRTIFEKLSQESNKCGYAVIVMTGDDYSDNIARARENVMHEIGYFQGKYGPDKVCILHEEGVNIPTNLSGIAYYPFPKGYIEVALNGLTRELKLF